MSSSTPKLRPTIDEVFAAQDFNPVPRKLPRKGRLFGDLEVPVTYPRRPMTTCSVNYDPRLEETPLQHQPRALKNMPGGPAVSAVANSIMSARSKARQAVVLHNCTAAAKVYAPCKLPHAKIVTYGTTLN